MFAPSRRRLLAALTSTVILAGLPMAAGADHDAAGRADHLRSLTEGFAQALVRARTLNDVASTNPDVRVSGTISAAPRPAEVAGVFAQVDGLDLHLPVASEALRLVGFHEARGPQAVLDPHGHPLADHNPSGTLPPAAPGPEYLVLPSRGRDGHARSAADIVVDRGAPVVAPVTGTVVGVDPYLLYDETDDWIISIRPAEAPHLLVKVFHVERPAVRYGDHVHARETVIAGEARLLPFISQIDEHSGLRLPHVHIQVERA